MNFTIPGTVPERPRAWTDADRAFLRQNYATKTNDWLSLRMGRSPKAIGIYATQVMKLHKRDSVLKACRFKPGQRPWNRGVRYQAGGASKQAQFGPGTRLGAAKNKLLPVGTVRMDGDGVWLRKVADIPGDRRASWRPVHVLQWEAINGPVPDGCLIVFADRDRNNFSPANLICLTRAENMARNARRTAETAAKCWATRKAASRRMVQLVGLL